MWKSRRRDSHMPNPSSSQQDGDDLNFLNPVSCPDNGVHLTHQALAYRTPAEVYGEVPAVVLASAPSGC